MHHEIRYFKYLLIFLSGLALPIVMPVAQWVAHFWLIWSFLRTVFCLNTFLNLTLFFEHFTEYIAFFMLSISCFSCQNVSCNIFNEFYHLTLWLCVKLKRKLWQTSSSFFSALPSSAACTGDADRTSDDTDVLDGILDSDKILRSCQQKMKR